MAITVEEIPGYLRRLAEKAAREAPIRAVVAMGNAYEREVVQSMGGASPSPPGTPPARVTGTLARSVRVAPAVMVSAYAASNSVAPHTVYARIQQYGGEIHARHLTAGGKPGYLRWEGRDGVHYRHSVTLPPRPYMIMPPPVPDRRPRRRRERRPRAAAMRTVTRGR